MYNDVSLIVEQVFEVEAEVLNFNPVSTVSNSVDSGLPSSLPVFIWLNTDFQGLRGKYQIKSP